jgi:regulator of sigma E protease
MLAYIGAILVMIFGFGFVIFWHELGHFLGARWAKMRVEQFAVGMGHAIVSYRKGIGLKFGNTREEFECRTRAEFARQQQERLGVSHTLEPTLREQYDAAKAIGIGETEYRLSWIPIGGYVKPTGQDDLRPAAQAAKDDPGSYAAAPVHKRMVMISAGVIMNVILAGILFFVLFRFVGFNAPRPIISSVQSNSPAALAGLQSGDELLSINGHTLHDFAKVQMWTALMPDDEPVDVKIRRNGQELTKAVELRHSQDNVNMLSMGVSPPLLLRAVDKDEIIPENFELLTGDAKAVLPEERIVAVNGKKVGDEDYQVYDEALQNSFGAPLELTVQAVDGTTRTEQIQPLISTGFNRQAIRFAGLGARTKVGNIEKKSNAFGKLKEGDIILAMRGTEESSSISHPSPEMFRIMALEAGAKESPLIFTVLRGDEILEIEPLVPNFPLPGRKTGLGVVPEADYAHAVVASETVATTRSSAQLAIVPAGATITAIDGKPVKSWFDVHRVLSTYQSPTEVFLRVITKNGLEDNLKVPLDAQSIKDLAGIRYTNPIATLDSWTKERKTDSALTAIGWGVTETRDLILQTYVTLRRVVGGSVPASNLSGPIGIFKTGTLLAQKGPDWFIWFLALVSANLAVVNFLPVPILDGWHFLSLLKEKITGTPVNEKLQEYASWLGLAMILSLLIFVTFNDLTR